MIFRLLPPGLLGGAAAAWPLAVRAQQRERVRRISMVNVIAETDPEASPRVAVFETALRKLGWTERISYRLRWRSGYCHNQVWSCRD